MGTHLLTILVARGKKINLKKKKNKKIVLVSLDQHFELSKANFHIGFNMLLYQFGYDT